MAGGAARRYGARGSEKGEGMNRSGRHRALQILVMMHGSGFPNGLAPTQRIRLEARALTEAGVRVTILLTRASDRPHAIRNARSEGEWHGVGFKYSTGTTVRCDQFLKRHWTDLRGVLGGITSIVSGWRTGEVDCVYLWMNPEKLVPFRMLRGLCALLGMPVVSELCEPPREVWKGAPLSQGAGRRHALLAHIDGFVAISGELERWVRTRKGGSRPSIVRVPILVDTDDVKPSFVHAVGNDVCYASAPGYLDEIEFLLDVVDDVREQYSDLRIRFFGWEVDQLARPGLRDRLRAQVAAGYAIVEGVVPVERLGDSYQGCAALLLPLKDEPRFVAAVPTKLAEYLASGRPVVATRIGELTKLLSDGENAFLADPGSVRSFADALRRALGDPEHSCAVGRGGRAVAEQVLDYRLYSEALASSSQGFAPDASAEVSSTARTTKCPTARPSSGRLPRAVSRRFSSRFGPIRAVRR